MRMTMLVLLMLVISFTQANEANEKAEPEKEVKEDISLRIGTYKALEGSTLKGTLQTWCLANSFTLDWKVLSEEGDEVDWEIYKEIAIKGSFYESVVALLRAYKAIDSRLSFNKTFFRNRVLRVYLEDAL